jgi:dATP pyrophosphohydrolase
VTAIAVAFVDVCVVRGDGARLEVLLLRRAAGGRSPGSWEGVHGRIDPGERPADTARRELREETGLTPLAWFNLSRVESFYQVDADRVVLIPVFAARVAPDTDPVLSEEHDAWQWLTPFEASSRCSWPRFSRSIDDLVRMIGNGVGTIGDAIEM